MAFVGSSGSHQLLLLLGLSAGTELVLDCHARERWWRKCILLLAGKMSQHADIQIKIIKLLSKAISILVRVECWY